MDLGRYEGFLLDLDETLVRTSHCWEEANNESVRQVFRDGLTPSELAMTGHLPLDQVLYQREHQNKSEVFWKGVEEILRVRNRMLLDIFRDGGASWASGAEEFLEELQARNFKRAIVSNSFRCALFALDARLNIRRRIRHAVLWDDVIPSGYGKPYPHMLNIGCNLIGAAPDRSVKIGDNINDEKAAEAAGSDFILTPGRITPPELLDRHQPYTLEQLAQQLREL